MKKIGKGIFWAVVGLVLIMDVLLTVYLLNYNQFNVSVINNKSLLVMTNKIENYDKGDLLVVSKTPDKEIRTGDYIFFYDTSSKEKLINYGRVQMVNVNKDTPNTFMMDNNYILGYETVIGRNDDVKVYKNLGAIVGALSSKWVFLIAIIMPILILFLYQLYLLIQEIKKEKA